MRSAITMSAMSERVSSCRGDKVSMSGAAKSRTAVVPVTGRSTIHSTMRGYGRVKDSVANKFVRLASNATSCWAELSAIDTSETIPESTPRFQNQSKNILEF